MPESSWSIKSSGHAKSKLLFDVRQVWQRCRRQFLDSGYYVEYGAENKLERNYSRQHVAVMRRAQYGTVDALDYSPQHDAERGPQYGTGEDYSRQQVAVMRPQYDTGGMHIYISLFSISLFPPA